MCARKITEAARKKKTSDEMQTDIQYLAEVIAVMLSDDLPPTVHRRLCEIAFGKND